MYYLLTQKNGYHRNDGCYELDQARVILLGKLALENRIYGVDHARKNRKDYGLIGDEITDQNVEKWARYYGFEFHRIEPPTWAEIADLLDQRKEEKSKRKINVQMYERVSSF